MTNPLQGKSLRKKAEKILPKKRKAPQKISSADTERLIHELEVHRVELEMQNQELRKAQEKIEKSRSQYVDLYDFAPTAYLTLDEKGVIREVNLTGASLLGIERRLLIKLYFPILIMPEDHDLFRDFLRKVLRIPGRQSCELRLKRGKNDLLWVRLEGVVVDEADGKLNRVRLALMDISDRKRAEEEVLRLNAELEAKVRKRTAQLESANKALRGQVARRIRGEEEIHRSEKEFRAIFELSSVGMVERDAATGKKVHVNQRLCEMTGYSAEELLSGEQVKLTHPDDWQRDQEVRAPVLKGELETWVIEKRLLRKNGEVIWAIVNGNLIRDSSGKPCRTVAVIQDITERKQDEERERKEHEETLFANRILRLFVELDGDELFDRTLAVVQESMASKHGIFGYIAEPGLLLCPSLSKMLDECEIEGKCIEYPPEKWKGLWARALTEKRSFHTNESSPVPPGHPIIHNNLAAPILFQGEAIGLLNLANKEGGYSQQDQEMLDVIAARMAPVLYAWIQRKLFDDERKKAEEDLRRSERRYRSFVEVTSQWAWVTDPAGLVVEDIPALRKFTGQTYEQAKGVGWADALHPDDVQRTLEVWKRAVSTKTPYEIEYRMRRYDGVYRLLLARGVPILNDQGSVIEWVGTCIDITERKATEEALRAARDRALWLARFPDENPNPVLRVSKDGRILYCNPSAEELPEWTCAVGQPLDSRLLPLVSRAMAEDEEKQEDVQIGAVLYSVCVAPFPEEGYANIYGRDVTERKRAEDALIKAHEELENRVRERTSELAEAVQRLQAEVLARKELEETLRESEMQVRLFATQCLTAQETERRRIAAELHDSTAASLAVIRLRIEKIGEDLKKGFVVTESLQDLSSKVVLTLEEVRRIMTDLRPSILDDLGILPAVNWLCREFQQTYPHLSVEKQIGTEEHEVPDSLKTPIFRIAQEAMNNVAKHSKASLVNLLLQKEGERIVLSVQDNGQGFDPEKVKKGMGLSNIRERAELSGGACELQSTMGKGTTVRVWWPIQVGNVA